MVNDREFIVRKKIHREKQNFKDEEVRTQDPVSHELSAIGMSDEGSGWRNMDSGMDGRLLPSVHFTQEETESRGVKLANPRSMNGS